MCHRKHAYIIWLNITRWHFRVAVAACTASKSMEVPVYPTFLPIIEWSYVLILNILMDIKLCLVIKNYSNLINTKVKQPYIYLLDV